jgi:hypothetical protein
MSTLPSMKAENSGHISGNGGAPDTAASSMPWMRVAAAGIGTGGRTRRRSETPVSSRPPASRTAAISTSHAPRGSRPVVSMSIATASRATRGVAPLPSPIGSSIDWTSGEISANANPVANTPFADFAFIL